MRLPVAGERAGCGCGMSAARVAVRCAQGHKGTRAQGAAPRESATRPGGVPRGRESATLPGGVCERGGRKGLAPIMRPPAV